MKRKNRQPLFAMLAALLLLFSVNAFAEWGGQCVRFIKNQRPGNYTWDKLYPVKKNNQPTAKKEYWIPAKDIWIRLWVDQRGSTPTKGAVLVLDGFGKNTAGHAAVITKVNGKKIYVRHSNWCNNNCETVSNGYFTLVGGGKVTYNGGSIKYPLLGFIYKP